MEPGKFYHISNHANGSENLFRTHENYRFFLARYTHFINTIGETYAYCLMPNHIHFLIRLKDEVALESTFGKFETFQKLESRLSKQFANLFSSYTQAYNKMYARRGSLFIPNFKRKEISDDNYLTALIIYIHLNPIHHGFVKNCAAWNWSSYHSIISDKPTALKREEILTWFGNKKEFLKLHEQPQNNLSKHLKLLDTFKLEF